MDNLRERVENALRFAPERMEKVILNAHIQPYFVKYGAFVYKKESFLENGGKKKTFMFVDLT